MEIREIHKRDYKKAIEFAIVGMHFDMYLNNKLLLKLYGRYFWYMELNRATQVLAAYDEDVLLGVLLAELNGEKQSRKSLWQLLYVRAFGLAQKICSRDGAGVYESANTQMLSEYLKSNAPDGEIIFLAADPETKARGIGTALLAELEKREKGKTVYLFTDDACTYQFYEHRGFVRSCEKDVILSFGGRPVPLRCFLFSKKIK